VHRSRSRASRSPSLSTATTPGWPRAALSSAGSTFACVPFSFARQAARFFERVYLAAADPWKHLPTLRRARRSGSSKATRARSRRSRSGRHRHRLPAGRHARRSSSRARGTRRSGSLRPRCVTSSRRRLDSLRKPGSGPKSFSPSICWLDGRARRGPGCARRLCQDAPRRPAPDPTAPPDRLVR